MALFQAKPLGSYSAKLRLSDLIARITQVPLLLLEHGSILDASARAGSGRYTKNYGPCSRNEVWGLSRVRSCGKCLLSRALVPGWELCASSERAVRTYRQPGEMETALSSLFVLEDVSLVFGPASPVPLNFVDLSSGGCTNHWTRCWRYYAPIPNDVARIFPVQAS